MIRRTIRRTVLLGAVAVVFAATAATASADPAKVGYPSSLASTGDSITRAFNTCSFPYIDCPQNSWSTGTSSTVNTVYRRILAANPAISGRNYNDARTGARMSDLRSQIGTAASQGVDMVTILMGANDVCTSSESTMTPVATLRSQLDQALAAFSAARPDARIAVSSIPNVYHLWEIFHANFGAVTVWSLFGICQSLLKNPLSGAQADVDRRARVAQRTRDDNDAIRDVCAQYVHCRFDGYAAYNLAFTTADVTTRDYFHPSVSGQVKAAATAWSSGFDFTDVTAPVSAGSIDGGTFTVSATDDRAVSGVEYRLSTDALGYRRYTGPVALATGAAITYRAVDVNGNVEASKTIQN
jgi:lysophospholipase L1-like esterase